MLFSQTCDICLWVLIVQWHKCDHMPRNTCLVRKVWTGLGAACREHGPPQHHRPLLFHSIAQRLSHNNPQWAWHESVCVCMGVCVWVCVCVCVCDAMQIVKCILKTDKKKWTILLQVLLVSTLLPEAWHKSFFRVHYREFIHALKWCLKNILITSYVSRLYEHSMEVHNNYKMMLWIN